MEDHILSEKTIYTKKPKIEAPTHIYEVTCNGFTTIVDVDVFPIHNYVPVPINAVLYNPSHETLATLNAVRIASNTANIYNTTISKDASLRDKWSYFAEINVALEKAMIAEGIEELTISTYTTAAKLLKEMGWVKVNTRASRIDLEKTLSEDKIHVPSVLENYRPHF